MMNPFLGQVQLFAFSFAPRGWVPCDGQLLPIAQNTALYQILGTTYGGDGQNTFALPDLAPLPAGPRYSIAVQGVFPQRAPTPR
jgi:microcystin-dependent protein